MGISVVLLAYKEEENLKVLLPQIIENVEKAWCFSVLGKRNG